MAIEINPEKTSRAAAFRLWMKAPVPMLTIIKTIDVTNLVKVSRRRKRKPNGLMCWCIGKAASSMEEFYLLPVEDKLMKYDALAINTVVSLKHGGISTCDIPFDTDLDKFYERYLSLTKQVRDTGEPYDISEEYAVIGTSALTLCEIDGAVNIYSGIFHNPFLVWGKFRKGFFKYTLPLSFQFHHTQMDGGHAAAFFSALQKEIQHLR